jgi:hypothetical protein
VAPASRDCYDWGDFARSESVHVRSDWERQLFH